MKFVRYLGSLAFVFGLFTVVFVGVPWYTVNAQNPANPWWLQGAVFLLMSGILLVLLSVALDQKNKSEPTELTDGVVQTDLIISNTDQIAGYKVVDTLGVVKGHTIYAIWIGNDLSALVRLILGGELTEYTDMMGKARSIASNRMIKDADALQADAIINVRYMTTSVVGSAAELLAYGTAVKLEKKE